MSAARARLAAIPHQEVSRETVVQPGEGGIAPHPAVEVTTACGRKMPATLTTSRSDQVRCPECKDDRRRADGSPDHGGNDA